ncbi:hypothetical protein BSL78_27462 [Apostichopus japonicus]|uniref:TNFR-Cys domain-containing protein n=1 Tax=Stichopus japonicus TaxID=307972 RepID=A0A2G8JIY4_STIJA|nr:hypothetical protein BSL78_27462 [Apostichopus japonicus]
MNSSIPTPCTAGTYREYKFGESEDDCLPCPVDHFNHLTGQAGCYHCGAEAYQELIGQSECTCIGVNREFQPSDRKCLCEHGYETLVGREQDCVKHVYEICEEGTSRNQDGDCLTETGWEEFCRNEGCLSPDDYIGYDSTLSLCKCNVDDLQEICDLECRLAQRNRIEMVCDDPPYMRVTYPDDVGTVQVPVGSLSRVINSRNAITGDQCDALDGSTKTIHMTEMSSSGFLGVYDPDATQVVSLLSSNAKGELNITVNSTSTSEPFTADPITATAGGARRRLLFYGNETKLINRKLLSTSDVSGSSFSGVMNPAVCLKYGETMMFYVDNQNYPVYSRENLYNTNEKFDYGGFRELEELQSQIGTSTTLFVYQFVDPGVYVFHLSNNTNRKMYIRVMAENAQCSEDGPYFPPTPRYVVQNGIAVESGILLAPDWLTISLVLALVLVLTILLVVILILFRKYGWNKESYIRPKYRAKTLHHNFDDYASKGSSVHHVKKYNRHLEANSLAAPPVEDVQIQGAADVKVREDEFWDYDKQVDLEAFSSSSLYGELSQQSRTVTGELGKQKEEAKSLYQKLFNQSESLKGLWVAKLNLQGKAALASEEDLAAYEAKREQLEMELERRRELGLRLESILKRQTTIMTEDEKAREEHQVAFLSAVYEANRLLNEYADKVASGRSLEEEFEDTLQNHVITRVGALVNDLDGEILNEIIRLGAYGFMGPEHGLGGTLILPDGTTPADKEDLFGKEADIFGVSFEINFVGNSRALIARWSTGERKNITGLIS